MPLVTIDETRCRKDGLCVRICPKVFTRKTADSAPVVEHEDACNSCGHCVLVCPSGALSQADSPPGRVHAARKDFMPTYEQVRELIVTRRSTRAFREQAVEREMVEKVIDGGRFAPSAKNSQSTRYMVIQDKTVLRDITTITAGWVGKAATKLKNPVWRRLYLLLGEQDVRELTRWIHQFELIAERARQGSDPILFGAPALILFYGNRKTRLVDVNASLAIQNASLTACSLGLGTFYTGYVVAACGRDKTIPRLIGLPKNHRVYGGLALGYPDIRFSRWIDRNPADIVWI